MKISCSKEALMNGINIVSKAVSTKSTMPNLQCILIESSLSEIRLIANDIELGIETIIEGNITEAGKIYKSQGTSGLKEYAKENLTEDEMKEIRGLYDKYKDTVLEQ